MMSSTRRNWIAWLTQARREIDHVVSEMEELPDEAVVVEVSRDLVEVRARVKALESRVSVIEGDDDGNDDAESDD
jgi:alpha-D-ribose 1-methylphosphonate 5-triphosphate synthase subunit PhnG